MDVNITKFKGFIIAVIHPMEVITKKLLNLKNKCIRVDQDINICKGVSIISVNRYSNLFKILRDELEFEDLERMKISTYINLTDLKSVGGNLFGICDSSGEIRLGAVLNQERGTRISGHFEKSNVEVAQEMINQILAQKALEINKKAENNAVEFRARTN